MSIPSIETVELSRMPQPEIPGSALAGYNYSSTCTEQKAGAANDAFATNRNINATGVRWTFWPRFEGSREPRTWELKPLFWSRPACGCAPSRRAAHLPGRI